MIIKNFINGQITTGTEPIDPISGVSRGLYINSVLSGNSSSDTLVGLDINPSYSGIAGNYFGLRVSGDTIFATTGGTQVFRTFNNGSVIIGSGTTQSSYQLDVNGTGRFSNNLTVLGSTIIDGIGSSEGFLEINSSQNDQNSAIYFYENPNGLGRQFASIIRYVGNGNTLRYLTKSGTETEYLRQSAGNSTFKQSVYVGDLQSLGSSGESPFDVYATPAGNGMVGTLRRSGTGDVMMGFHQWGGTAYAIGAISGNNGFGFFNGRYSVAAGTEVARFSGNNNLLIGTTTDAGFKLDVNGTGRFSGNVNIAGGSAATQRQILFQSQGIKIKHNTNGLGNNIVIGWDNDDLPIDSTTQRSTIIGFQNTGNIASSSLILGAINRLDNYTGGTNIIVGNALTLNATTAGTGKYFGCEGTVGAAFNGIFALSTFNGFPAITEPGVPVIIGTGQNNQTFNNPTICLGQFQHDNTLPSSSRNNHLTTTNGVGSDIEGYNLIISTGKSTGAATPKDLIFATTTALSSGTTRQTLSPRWYIKGQTGTLSNVISPNDSASLQIDSTTKGFLGPRMTTTQRDAIVSPATGLQVFNTTLGTLDLYDGTGWDRFGSQTLIRGVGSTSSTFALLVQNSGNTVGFAVNDAGNTLIGLTGDTGFKLSVSGSTLLRGSGTTSASYALATQNSSGGTTMVVNNAGNMLIGTTTDAGYKLDVNGTIRGQSGLWGGDVFLGNISGTRFIYLPSGYGLYIGSVGNVPTVLGDSIFSTTLNATINRFTLSHTLGSEQVTKLVGGSSVNHLNPFFDIVASVTSSPSKEIDMRIYTDYYSGTQRWGNIILGHNGNNTAGNILMGTNVGNGSRLLIGGTVSGATLSTTRAVHINPTLLATGNTTTLIGLDIQPTYSIGSYTGLTQIALRVSGGTQIIGSGSTGTTLSLFSVDGASGRLFDVTDDFTNSLFSVNTSSGVPVIEAFANNSIVMGTYGSNALVVSGTSIGIGKTSPLYKLDVNGDINVSERLLIESYSSATTQTTSVISATTTNSGIVISPNGTGAITVVVPDGTSVGGNSRGTYSIDLQRNRLLATSVASGSYSSIIGGYNNSSTGDYSVSFGKDSNSYLYGQQSFSSGYYASVGDTQHSTVSLRGVGTGGTNFSFYLTLDGTSSGNYLTPSGDNRTWGVKVLYTAACVQPGVGNNYVKGDSSMGEYVVLLRKSGGTTSIIDTSGGIKVSSSQFINDKLTFDVGSNQDLRILYTAPSANVFGNVIRAVAKLTLIEIGY